MFECLEKGGWPFALAYDITIGNLPGDSKLCDNPIKLIGAPISAFNYDYLMRINSYFVGDGYILTSGSGKWITKIDLKKREWTWLKELDCEINFSKSIMYNEKIWAVDDSREHFGAYWFDPVSLEDGFVKFNVEIPSFFSTYFSNWMCKNGKITYSGADPSTGNIITIVIDITTGEAVTNTQAPEMIFQTLINLN